MKRSARPEGAQSWFNALGMAPETGAMPLDDGAGDDAGWRADGTGPEDSRFLARQARRLVTADETARRRVFSTYLAARATLALALLAAQGAIYFFAGHAGSWLPLICGVYAALAVAWWWRSRRALSNDAVLPSWSGRGTVGVDVVAFSVMHWMDAGGSLNHAALLVLPVLMAGVLLPRILALATAAAVALMLLAVASQRSLAGGDLTALLSQAGLVGIGLFVIVLVAGQMASRLAREERTARGSLELARQQAELNRLVIDEMSDGVLVVDRRGRVRSANPAARELLAEGGACPVPPFSLHGDEGWRSLLTAVQQAFAAGHWPDEGVDLALSFAKGAPRSVRARARFTRRTRTSLGDESGSEELAVLFVEELRNVLARQRQERLLAMGRISAGIAHEIRNPLAAVAQANALLQEDALRPDQQRLLRIVADNVERLKRIVDDVMEAAPGRRAPSRTIDLTTEVGSICGEWLRTVGLTLGVDCRLSLQLPAEPLGAIFDPDHLRRVLVNLLENGLRHAGASAGAVQLTLEALDGRYVRLAVASDGDLIAPDVEVHLFEPFHSTRSRGTGLGLYICRELCERHGASIDYRRQPGARHGNVFQVVMRRDAISGEGRLHL
jgi:two-component system, NtrC family, sensor histidine kinase PilS